MLSRLLLIFALIETLIAPVTASAQTSLKAYSRAYPHFIQYCSGSQLKPKDQERGGLGGHAVLYVHGLCKNENLDYPAVETCSRILKMKHPHEGVGISVDKYFKNVNWVAVPGYDYFINGSFYETDHVGIKARDQVIQQAVELGIFQGVNYDIEQVSDSLKNEPEKYQAAIAMLAVGTDLAVQWGRDLKCVRLPLLEDQLFTVRDFLNRLNEKYYHNPDQPFEWSAIFNNCTHTSSNTFAELGVRDYLDTDSNWFWQAANLAVPANSLMTLQYLTQANVPTWDDVKPEGMYEKTFERYGQKWLPARHGALTLIHPVFKNNSLFDTDLKGIWLMPKPVTNFYDIRTFHTDHASTKPYTDLKTNLNLWKARYNAELKKVESLGVTKRLRATRQGIETYYLEQLRDIEQIQARLKKKN